MKIPKKYTFLFGAMILSMLIMSACNQTTTGSTTSNLSPLQVLQKSGDAMKGLKSSHIEVQSIDNVQTSGSSGTPAAGTPTVSANNVNVTIKGSGDQAGVDQQKMDITVTALNQSTSLSEIVLADKVYVKGTDGKWYVLKKSDYESKITSNPFAGLTFDQKTLLGIIQHVKIDDHGAENLAGQSLRHITASLDKEALKQLLAQDPQVASMLGQKNLDQFLNNTKSFASSVDVWIDETQFYVHRTQLKINVAADTSSVGNGAPAAAATQVNVTVDLSKFNDPITVTAPVNAIPTSNPADILGGITAR